jgi:hypothetical protein
MGQLISWGARLAFTQRLDTLCPYTPYLLQAMDQGPIEQLADECHLTRPLLPIHPSLGKCEGSPPDNIPWMK